MARGLNEGGEYTSPFSNLYLHLPHILAHQYHFSGFHSCSTLCNSTDFSLPGFSVHGISQVRILEWVAVSCSGDLPNPRIEPVSCIGRWVLYHRATWEAHTPWITYAFIPDLLVPGWNHSVYSHLNLTSLAPTCLHCIGFSQALLY